MSLSLAHALGVDDGLTILYEVPLGTSPNHVQHASNIERTGIRFETGSDGIGQKVQSVWVFGRRYGAGTGDITVTVRKASDDTIAATLGTFDVRHFPVDTEFSFAIRSRPNTYQMVDDDIVSIEYPANDTDGFEITTNSSESNPTGYTSRSYNGTVWSSALSDPLAIIIKG